MTPHSLPQPLLLLPLCCLAFCLSVVLQAPPRTGTRCVYNSGACVLCEERSAEPKKARTPLPVRRNLNSKNNRQIPQVPVVQTGRIQEQHGSMLWPRGTRCSPLLRDIGPVPRTFGQCADDLTRDSCPATVSLEGLYQLACEMDKCVSKRGCNTLAHAYQASVCLLSRCMEKKNALPCFPTTKL